MVISATQGERPIKQKGIKQMMFKMIGKYSINNLWLK